MARIKKYKRRRGTVAVEAALMMPLIMLMTLALIKYGWLYVKVQQVNNAARHGARVAARADSENQDVLDAIELLMAPMWPAGVPVPSDGWYDDPTIDPTLDLDLPTGTIVTVTITVPYAGTPLDIIPVGVFLPVPVTIGGTASMAREGT